MMQSADIVVVGGGYAGVYAATRAARTLGGQGRVVLVSPDDVLVERIRLHENVVHGRQVAHPLARFLSGTGVTHVRARVIGHDADAQSLVLDAGRLGYARLVLTVGSEAAIPDVPGASEHARSLAVGSSGALRAEIARVVSRGGRVVVCGGGLTGVEVATELAEAHPRVRVTLLTSGPVAPLVSDEGRAHVRRVCAGLGIALHENATVTTVAADHVIASGTRHDADLCIWAGGFVASRLPSALGLRVNALGQARVDEALRAEGHAHVFVAGDAAAPALASRAAPLPMGCKTALPQGAHAADNAVASLRGAPLAPFSFTDSIFCISLGRRDGLIQRLSRDGAVLPAVITGLRAAFVKELVCRYTIGALLAARGLLAAVRGVLSPRPVALPGAVATEAAR